MNKIKICVVTGTRAEYGLLRWVMDGILRSKRLKLQIIATGMHLSQDFGFTFKEIEKDGFKIDKKVDMSLNSDTAHGITKSMSKGMIGFSSALEKLNPDLLLVLGDRFEIFSATCIPVTPFGKSFLFPSGKVRVIIFSTLFIFNF